MAGPFSGTVYEPYDFPFDGTHALVVHGDPDVEQSGALRSLVRSHGEMQEFSRRSFELLRDEIPGDICLFRLPTEGFLTIAVGFTLSPPISDWDEQLLLDRLKVWLLRGAERIEALLAIRLNIFVSELHINTRNVYDAYQEAFSIAYHRPFLQSAQQIMLVRDLKNGLAADVVVEKRLLEEQFFESISSHRYQESEELLMRIVKIRASAPGTVTSLKQELIARLDYFAYLLLDSLALAQISRERLIVQIDLIHSAKSMAELEMRIHNVFLLFQTLWDSHQSSPNPGWAARLSDYVKKNYSDPEMSAALLSRVFGLNPAYISHVFHKSTGIKLVDFIHVTRIEHIKLLLSRTAMDLGQIALRTGYYDSRAMSRVFTRYEKMTPTQYRKLHRG